MKYTTEQKVSNLLSTVCQLPCYDLLGDEGIVDDEYTDFFVRPSMMGYADYSRFHKGYFIQMCDGSIYEIAVKKVTDKQYDNMVNKKIIDPNKGI